VIFAANVAHRAGSELLGMPSLKRRRKTLPRRWVNRLQ
jgi:hypothetical protein